MKIEYDSKANACYIYLREIEPGGVARTIEATPWINLDFDELNKLIGVEILHAVSALPQGFLDDAEQIANRDEARKRAGF